jgi:hypothetical protein
MKMPVLVILLVFSDLFEKISPLGHGTCRPRIFGAW